MKQVPQLTSTKPGRHFGLPLSSVMVALTVLLDLPVLTGHWAAIVPYWYNSAALDFVPLRLLPGLLAISIYLMGYHLLAEHHPRLITVWSLLGSVAVPVALLAPIDSPFYVLVTRTLSPMATGGFTLGAALTPAMLHDWPTLMPGWRVHVPHIAISAPGWPLLYYGIAQGLGTAPALSQELAAVLRPLQCHTWDWGLNQVTNAQLASAWLGIASPFWAALTILPLTGLGRKLVDQNITRTAICLWPLVPALTAFAGTLNTCYPFFAVLMIYLVWPASSNSTGCARVLRLSGAGLLLGLLLLLNFSLIPLLLLAGLIVLIWFEQGQGLSLRGHLGQCSAAAGLLVLPILAVAVIYGQLTGHSLQSVFSTAMQQHLAMSRPYLASMALHAWDLVVFTGPPVVMLALFGASRRLNGALARLSVALGLTFLFLLVSGSAQGEVGRVWIFLMPFMLLLAAVGLQNLSRRSRWLMIGAQVLWLVSLSATNRPIDTWVGRPPGYARVADAPLTEPLLAADAAFGGEMRLTGFQSKYHPESGSLTLALHWQPARQMDTPYYFSAVLVAPDGQVLPAVTWQPFDKQFPTTCWPAVPAGQEVVDQVELPLGTNPPAGNWWLSLAAFAMHGEQVIPLEPVHLPGGAIDHQVGLGPIAIGEQR